MDFLVRIQDDATWWLLGMTENTSLGLVQGHPWKAPPDWNRSFHSEWMTMHGREEAGHWAGRQCILQSFCVYLPRYYMKYRILYIIVYKRSFVRCPHFQSVCARVRHGWENDRLTISPYIYCTPEWPGLCALQAMHSGPLAQLSSAKDGGGDNSGSLAAQRLTLILVTSGALLNLCCCCSQ